MKTVHYFRLLLAILAWQFRNYSDPSLALMINDTKIFSTPSVEVLMPIIFCVGMYLIGFLLSQVVKFTCGKQTVANDDELYNKHVAD